MSYPSIRLAALSMALAIGTVQAEDKAEKDADWQKDAGYSNGYIFGQRLQSALPDMNLDGFFEGMKDAYAGDESRLSETRMQELVQQQQIEARQRMDAEMAKQAEANAATGSSFLSKNGEEAGVITTDSGLQYKILEEGSGESPDANDSVKVHYTGTLIDGTEFDSSRARNEPATFPVNRVIPGWTEAMQLMKPGSRWMLYIPPELAYGATQRPGIPPNSTLVFDVELLEVQKQE